MRQKKVSIFLILGVELREGVLIRGVLGERLHRTPNLL